MKRVVVVKYKFKGIFIIIKIAILSVFCMPYVAKAQEQHPADTSITSEERQWERLMESASQDKEARGIADEAAQLEDNPLDLNTVSEEELSRIPGMQNLLASRIVAMRKLAQFASVDELLAVEGMTPELLSFIRKYVIIKQKKIKSVVTGSFRSRSSVEIERRKGFRTGAYYDSPAKIFNRFYLSYGMTDSPSASAVSKIEVGALAEKDPGERSLASFSTGFLSISFSELPVSCIVGDYRVESAEGLVFWRRSAFSKGSDVIGPARKNGSGVHPYLSSDENSYFRGIAASVELKNIQLQLLYSDKFCNATIDTLGRISSFYESGLFRTENELRKEKSTREIMVGYRVIAQPLDRLKIGATGYKIHFANPLLLDRATAETTSNLWMQAMDISYTIRNVDIFSELAIGRTKTTAIIGGMAYEPVSTLSLTMVARKYPAAFQSIHGNAFGEFGDQVQNENGVYIGVKFKPVDRLWISTYFDQFEHPQPTASIPAPSNGNDFLAMTEYQITKKYKLEARFKRKELPSVIEGRDLYGRAVEQIVPRVQKNIRLTGEFSSSSSVQLRSRIEWMAVNYGGINEEKGLLLSQSMKLLLFRIITLQTRIAVFETDSYDSRIYDFESDLAGVFSNPALYGRGLRWYIILRYRLFARINISAKYSRTIKEGVNSLGSGLDEIEGDSQSTLSMQLDIRF